MIRRLSREEGIQEMRKGVLLAEERAWIFVPALDIWIYDSVNFAGSNTVGVNTLLHQVLIAEFGAIESFHTHTRSTIENIYLESPSFARKGVTFERFKAAAAIPSADDIFRVLELIDLNKGESQAKATFHIIHELGMTTFGARVFPYIGADGERTRINPMVTTWSFTDLLELDLPPSEQIELMFRQAEENSTASVECLRDICDWPNEAAPRLKLEHREF